MSKKNRTTLIAIVVLVCSSVLIAREALARTQRIAVVVGNNVGIEDDETLKYAENEALEIYRLLLEIGGVNPSFAHLSLGKDSKEVLEILRMVKQRVSELEGGGEVLLVFYYSGHASTESLHMENTQLGIAELVDSIRGTGAHTTITFVDSCKSGTILRLKGGVAVQPPFEINVTGQEPISGHVVITSSGPSEVSMEAEELGGSFFSHYLISGMRGDADQNKDGRIDLNEVYSYTYSNTVARTMESRVGVQHPSFDYDIEGAGSIVMTWPAKSEATLSFGPGLEGEYLIVTKYNRVIVAEVNLEETEQKNIALPAQSYVVKKRVKGGYLIGEVNLNWGGEKKMSDTKMELFPYSDVEAKGNWGTFDPNEIIASFRMRSGVVGGNNHLAGGALRYRRLVSELLEIGVSASFVTGTTSAVDLQLATHELNLETELLFVIALNDVKLNFGAAVGAMFVWQDIPGWDTRYSPGFIGTVTAGAVWIPADPFAVTLDLRAGIEGINKNDTFTWGPRIGLAVGLGMRF